jgi:hypothetical protein
LVSITVTIVTPIVAVIVRISRGATIQLPSFNASVAVTIQPVQLPSFDSPIAVKIQPVAFPSLHASISVPIPTIAFPSFNATVAVKIQTIVASPSIIALIAVVIVS